MSSLKMEIPTTKLDAKAALDFRIYGRYFSFLRRHPTHAARLLFGIKIPPHESVMLENCWMGYGENHFQCSRGTSKTFVVGSLDSALRALLFSNSSILNASASKFRGGKSIIKDSGKLLEGRLRNQRLEGMWGRASLLHAQVVRKEPDMWSIDFSSNSTVFTIPTNNEDTVRGTRATTLKIDERNTFDGEMIKKVYKPFVLVGTDFENPVLGSEDSQVFYLGTIDYSYRDWYKELASTQDIIRAQYEMAKALREQNWDKYDYLMTDSNKLRINTSSVSLIRFDYTDLIIPTTIGKYKVNFPGATKGKQIVWDERDKKEYIYTYPLNKRQIEHDLDEGLIDTDSWLAEHRNVFIEASGNVYPPSLIDKVTSNLFTEEEERSRGWERNRRNREYFAPVLYTCSDPCVLGVDTARTADFAAFVVIRIGQGPKNMYTQEQYSLDNHLGMSPWNNVIWAEQHQKLTIKDITDIIYTLRKRYNIVATREVPGISMDARGGGTSVRDELANPTGYLDAQGRVTGPNMPQRIFDPEDAEFKHLLADPAAWFGLRLLWTSDQDNHELVGFSKAQMEAGRLFIPHYLDKTARRDPDNLLAPGYMGCRTLASQLLRVQAILTETGTRVRYDIPGNKNLIENKKDMFMAFLYACNSLRVFLNVFNKPTMRDLPAAYGQVVHVRNKFFRR